MRRSASAVLDLNHILLFLACVSPVVVLTRSRRHLRSWRLPAVAVLIVTALAWLIAPAQTGFVGGGAWLLLLFVPTLVLRNAARAFAEERYASAQRFVRLASLLHPARELREQRVLLEALICAERSDIDQGDRLLSTIASPVTLIGRRAIAQRFRIRGDWAGLLEWCRAHVPRVGVGEDPSLLLLYFRALGELGLRDELVVQFAGRAPVLQASPLHQRTFLIALMMLFAFCGRTAALRVLLEKALRRLPRERKEFWLARSRAAPALSLPNESTMRRFERGVRERRSSLIAPPFGGVTPAVLAIIAVNVAMFVAEIVLGGATNTFALHRLGGLDPAFILATGQYWRLVSALFLHYGALHLLVNLYALYILGGPLENTIGTFRFIICYLLSGLGSSAGVLGLWRLNLTQADLLVGASGAIMGIVGTWCGFLVSHRHVPMVRRRLMNLVLIVLIQTAFDFYIPQISMAAHLCGFASGVVLGLLIAPARHGTLAA